MKDIEHLFINFTYQSKKDFTSYYNTLVKEVKELKANYQLNIKTIYIATNDFLFLTSEQLKLFLNLITANFITDLIEYSFEIGYQTLKQEHLAILKQFKINRLVWKVRTFSSELLLNVNKRFKSETIKKLIQSSVDLDYQNFSIDLEDNIIRQTATDILEDLKIALKFKVPHISYQSHTDAHNYDSKKIISDFLIKNHYHNYEFFSFALAKNNYSKQTIAYLMLKNWYGLGPNASSFLKIGERILTIKNTKNIPWIKTITTLNNSSYYQLLILQNLMLEKGLLLTKNLSLKTKSFWPNILKLIKTGFLQIENRHLKATNKGWILLNEVLIDIIDTKEVKERG